MDECDDIIFSFKTTNIRLLKNVIESIAAMDETCNFIFSPDGIRVQIIDTTKSLLLQITLHKGFFNELICTSQMKVGLCVEHFKYALGNANDKDEFAMNMITPDAIDFIHHSNNIDTVVRANAINIEFEELELNGSSPDIFIEMKSHVDMKRILTQMKSNSETVRIEVSDNAFNLSMRTEMLEHKTRLNQTKDVIITKCDSNYSSDYKTIWLCTISNGLSKFNQSVIELSMGKPLRWYSSVENTITIEYYVSENTSY